MYKPKMSDENSLQHELASKKYRTIYADPPWMEVGGGKIRRGADAHYPLMKTNDICALPIAEIADENAHLYLWVTNNFLPDGLKVIEAWGFRYVTCITWFKDRIGLGQYFRGQTEHCLFAVKGMVPYKVDENGKRMQGVTGFSAIREQHSKKPEDMRRMIEKVSSGPYVELFARRPSEGWDVWGNEVECDLDLKSQEEYELAERGLISQQALQENKDSHFRPDSLSEANFLVWL